ncbi:MAG: metallophosphoesterase [Bacteroidales bacterium]
MKKLYLISFFIIVVLSISSCSQNKKLVILHLNDTHSQVEPQRVGLHAGLGGVSRHYEYIEQVRKENPNNTLLFHSGDFNQGTPYYTVFHGEIEISLLNLMKFDAITLGNHEFDNGQEHLAKRLDKLNMPIVVSNYDFKNSPIAKYIDPYIIIEKNGIKIGIVGALVDISNLVAKDDKYPIVYYDPIDIIDNYAEMLKEEKDCDIVIALTHLGYSDGEDDCYDLKLAAETSNIDLIIGGHSHTFLEDKTTVINKAGEKVYVVQAGAKGYYVGRIDLSL